MLQKQNITHTWPCLFRSIPGADPNPTGSSIPTPCAAGGFWSLPLPGHPPWGTPGPETGLRVSSCGTCTSVTHQKASTDPSCNQLMERRVCDSNGVLHFQECTQTVQCKMKRIHLISKYSHLQPGYNSDRMVQYE